MYLESTKSVDPPRSHSLKHSLELTYPIAERGEGVFLFDADGRDYLDGSSGAMIANTGHGVKAIAKAIYDQARRIAFTFRTQFTSRPAEGLASKLAALAPGDLNHVAFVNSGSEAAEYAMRAALPYWRSRNRPSKTRILGRERSYHGMTMGSLSMSGHPERRGDYGPLLLPLAEVPPPYCYRCPWGKELVSCAAERDRSVEFRETVEQPFMLLSPSAIGVRGGALLVCAVIARVIMARRRYLW